MTWSEHWPIDAAVEELEPRAIAAAIEDALAARDLAIGPAIVHESGEVEGVRLESFGRYVTISLGLGDLRGAITIARPDGEDPGYAEFNSDDARGPWEPLYALFAELAIALGAAQEPPIAAELDPAELREDLRATVDACVADALDAGGPASAAAAAGDAPATTGAPTAEAALTGAALAEAEIADAPGEAPLDAFELELELRADALVARVTGAGARFVVTARGLAAGLSPGSLRSEGRAAIERALREDLAACVAAHRWLRHQRAAPPADPARAGGLFLERRADGRAVSAEELTSLDALRAALAEHDADVIRYFSSGEPFWKASFERGHRLDDQVTSLDDLHAERTWQWQA